MPTPKNTIPKNAHRGVFHHPDTPSSMILILREIEDPREPSCNFRHSLLAILLVVILGWALGATDLEEALDEVSAYEDDLRQWVDLPHGMPSIRTVQRVLAILDGAVLMQAVNQLSELLVRQAPGSDSQEVPVIACDGKVLRGAPLNGVGDTLTMIHAWSTAKGLVLGQMEVPDGTGEAPTLRKLLELLNLKGTIVTADSAHTCVETAKQIVTQGAAYILPVKGNQSSMLLEIEQSFQRIDAEHKEHAEALPGHAALAKSRKQAGLAPPPELPNPTKRYQASSVEKGHGRIEERFLESLSVDEASLPKGWEHAHSIHRLTTKRTLLNSDGTPPQSMTTVRYLVSSLKPQDSALTARAHRAHWEVENKCHWVLDVVMREDAHNLSSRRAAANLSYLRKIGLSLAKLAAPKLPDEPKRMSHRRRTRLAKLKGGFIPKLVNGLKHLIGLPSIQ